MPGADGAPRRAVVDASVVVRWVVAEPGTEQAMALLRQSIQWLAPRLMLTELASALRRKVVGGDLSTEVAFDALDAVTGQLGTTIELVTDEQVMPLALSLSLSLAHKVPDCVYLAVAEREGADLVTADRRLGEVARTRGVLTTLLTTV